MSASPLASPSATIAVLKRHGLYTKKSMGQHFLVDDNVVSRILALAALESDDIVLEIGPGIGTLTVALCAAAGSVVAVERDAALQSVLAETTAQCRTLAVIQADAVTVAPDRLAEPFGAPSALVSNLPYQVAATVVLRFFETMPSIQQATVMVQAEVADRMAASPGTKEYGSYTVKLGLRAKVAGRFNVSPGCFLPPPRVESSVIRLERLPDEGDPALVHAASRVADAAFSQRRKTIRNCLRSALGVTTESLDRALEAAGVDGGVRAESLPPATFVELARQLARVGL